jgi:hypothetical protein
LFSFGFILIFDTARLIMSKTGSELPVTLAGAQDNASGSSRRIAISADVSTIIEVIRVRHKGGRHDRRNGTAP